jgi:hypothetical protein
MELLVDVLRAHGRSNAEVARECCEAIVRITTGNAENQVKYGSVAGSVSVLVDLLKAHGRNPASEDALKFCCWAIEKLSEGNFANKVKFNTLKTIHILEVEVTALPNDDRFKQGALKQLRGSCS